jgi:hypothetical protein
MDDQIADPGPTITVSAGRHMREDDGALTAPDRSALRIPTL